LLQVVLFSLPWSVRRRALNRIFGFEIAPTARIGLSIVLPDRLVMEDGAVIGNFNLARSLEELSLGPGAMIGRLNYVFGIPRSDPQLAGTERRIALVMERGALLMNRHQVDCSSLVTLGENCLVAGAGTAIASHWIDMGAWAMRSAPVQVGAHSMVGTRCILLGGAALPPRSALGAGSVLRSTETLTERIYSGVPATAVATIDHDAKFFTRTAQLGVTELSASVVGRSQPAGRGPSARERA
jgi:acetyltransferase-like isoleucine patch superfamily enzyme